MTTEPNPKTDPGSESKLLNPEERTALNQIAAQDPPFSQRAQALLAIDQGATQSAAGQESGLSLGQVRYWLGKFRKNRLSIFPEALLIPAEEEAGSPPDTPELLSPPDSPDPKQAAVEEEVQKEIVKAEETAEPVGDAPAPQADPPEAKKKPKKKSKKSKKEKKGKKKKKSKKKSDKKEPKKKKKGKKSKKKGKKKKMARKEKDSKGKSGKKKKKKRKK